MQGSVSGSPLSPVPQSLSDRPASPSAQAPLQDPVNQPATKRTKFSYVLVPQLSQGTKENYKATEEVGLKMEMEIKLDEVIGEYREGNTDYYFARYEDGIAHKVSAIEPTKGRVLTRRSSRLVPRTNFCHEAS